MQSYYQKFLNFFITSRTTALDNLAAEGVGILNDKFIDVEELISSSQGLLKSSNSKKNNHKNEECITKIIQEKEKILFKEIEELLTCIRKLSPTQLNDYLSKPIIKELKKYEEDLKKILSEQDGKDQENSDPYYLFLLQTLRTAWMKNSYKNNQFFLKETWKIFKELEEKNIKAGTEPNFPYINFLLKKVNAINNGYLLNIKEWNKSPQLNSLPLYPKKRVSLPHTLFASKKYRSGSIFKNENNVLKKRFSHSP